ncbi:C-C chemokine receptor type 3 [Denticeps clupeoides]|uniref:G-protein coupled receptors family 1 profile domain-containing protein n=1 Tax=Denticeps clupeoides TaxID=299321 RepID=A0AAY4BGC1_9TELE|nr:C-C chemokine receptor type 3-like [Denticeps clupeoides]
MDNGTTVEYDYGTIYDYDNATLVTMCNTSKVNRFGATFLPTFYLVIFVLSLTGNVLVLLVIYKFERLSSVTNIILLNLIGSNLLFTFVLPFWAVYHSSSWVFGQPMCKIVRATLNVGFKSSVLFLTLMTFDRYLAIVHAVAMNQHRTKRYALLACALVWLVCMLAGIEGVLQYHVEYDPSLSYLCTSTKDEKWKKLVLYVDFTGFFLFPLLVVIFCYVRIIITVFSTRISGKHKTLRIVFVILVLFFVCWTPYNVVKLIYENKHSDCSTKATYGKAKYVTHNIAHLYFCINPVFYCFLGRKFQSHVRFLLVNYFPCLKEHVSLTNSKSTSFRSPQTMQE